MPKICTFAPYLGKGVLYLSKDIHDHILAKGYTIFWQSTRTPYLWKNILYLKATPYLCKGTPYMYIGKITWYFWQRFTLSWQNYTFHDNGTHYFGKNTSRVGQKSNKNVYFCMIPKSGVTRKYSSDVYIN